jgi:hypothetical protein
MLASGAYVVCHSRLAYPKTTVAEEPGTTTLKLEQRRPRLRGKQRHPLAVRCASVKSEADSKQGRFLEQDIGRPNRRSF